jgi:hypothetical protein
MSYRTKTIAAAMLSLASFVPISLANAADQAPPPAYKVKAKPVADLPFFFVIDDRVTYSWMPKGTDPGAFTVNPNGSVNGTTSKSVYSFTHFDAWAYGTNFFTISMLKSDHNDPASPCTEPGQIFVGAAGNVNGVGCAGATEIYGLFRSTFGFNEIFGTKAFSVGPLHNVSLEIGADANSENTVLAPAKRDFVAGLQFAFDLPYKGYINVAPLAYKEINHNGFDQCGSVFPAGQIPGVSCLADGNTDFHTTWAVEINYYMDLGFLPESVNYFAISGRAGFYGPKGNQNQPLGVAGGGTPTKTEINTEPVRLTFDASKALWGPKYAQFITTWVAYRYWQNKFGLDHNSALGGPGVCVLAGTTISTNSCTESTVYAGVTVKF